MSNFKKFKELFESNFNEFLEIAQLKNEIETHSLNISLLSGCVSRLSTSHPEYPIIVGNSLSRASITNLGSFPPYKFDKYHIYPSKYTVKKRFRPHPNYKRSMNNKVLYVCTVEDNGVVITADDGFVWKGNSVWADFTSDLGITNEFESIEDFMSLNNPNVIKMIEALGDVESLEGYVPLSSRK